MPRAEKFSADNFFLEKKQFPFRPQGGMEVFLRERNGGQKIFSLVAKYFHVTGCIFPFDPWSKYAIFFFNPMNIAKKRRIGKVAQKVTVVVRNLEAFARLHISFYHRLWDLHFNASKNETVGH